MELIELKNKEYLLEKYLERTHKKFKKDCL
jgi:hypothetical protein